MFVETDPMSVASSEGAACIVVWNSQSPGQRPGRARTPEGSEPRSGVHQALVEMQTHASRKLDAVTDKGMWISFSRVEQNSLVLHPNYTQPVV